MAEKKITQLITAVAADLGAETTDLEVAVAVTTTPASRKITLGTLRDFLASAATGFAAVAVTVLSLHAGNIGVGVAPAAEYGLVVAGSLTAVGGGAAGISSQSTLIASANGDLLAALDMIPTFTPGAFTGLSPVGLRIGPFSTAGFSSPASPQGINVGRITGTGASDVYGIVIAPPIGATNNWLLAASDGSFSVSGTGHVEALTYTVTGGSFAPATLYVLSNEGLVVAGAAGSVVDMLLVDSVGNAVFSVAKASAGVSGLNDGHFYRDVGVDRNLFVGGVITIGSATLILSSVALSNAAAGGVGSLTNTPSSGNPSKYLVVNDNGTLLGIPAWTI